MSWCWRRSALLLAPALAAAHPAPAQSVTETQVWAVAVASRPGFYGGGFGLGWRNGQRDRLAPAVALGELGDGHFGARADLSYQFLLDPDKRSGAAVYGGGGLTAALARGRVTPYLLLVLGVENAPGGSGGSFLEIGVGGGVRIAVGYRWRKHNAPGR
jgi:hypothetical protein